MFNIYLNNLFYVLNDVDICNYADDTTPNVCDSSLKVVIEKLEKSSQLAIKWFNHNYMKLNAKKCEFLITGHRFEHLWLNVYHQNIRKLMIEVYKSLNKPSPDNYFDSLFTSKRRQDPLQNDLLVPSIRTVTKDKDSAKYLGAVTWNSIPSHIRQQDSLEKFCDLIKNGNLIVNVNYAKII